MQPKKNSLNGSSRSRAPLLGTLSWGFTIWIQYVLMKSSLESRMLTVEKVSPEELDLIYQREIDFWIHRNYLTGAILGLWLVYLMWRWVRFFRGSRQALS
jgi:hypothetical protein